MSEHGGHTLPGEEVDDADVFSGAAGGHVLTRRVDLQLPDKHKSVMKLEKRVCQRGERSVERAGGNYYPQQAAIFT